MKNTYDTKEQRKLILSCSIKYDIPKIVSQFIHCAIDCALKSCRIKWIGLNKKTAQEHFLYRLFKIPVSYFFTCNSLPDNFSDPIRSI